MPCTMWNESLTGRLYGEIAPADDAALTEHLETCVRCRSTLEEFRHLRTLLRDEAPSIPRTSRVVVLRDRSRLRPALLAASILGAAVLAGAGAGAGYAMGRTGRMSTPAIAAADPAVAAPSTEDIVRRQLDERLAAWDAARAGVSPAPVPTAVSAPAKDPGVSASELKAELAKFERRLDGARAADLDYVLEQVAASEYRVANRIGKTNEALRTVALASNPYVKEQ